MKVIDLSDVIAPHAEKKVIGIRPGEKMHEVLMTEEESKHAREFTDSFVIEPEYPFWNVKKLKGGKKLTKGFRYASDVNKKWYTQKDLKKIIKEL